MKFFPDPYEPNYEKRDPHPEGDPLFHRRWSPRSFEKIELSDETMDSLLDAARWAPSAYNEQPWRFLVSSGEESSFRRYLALLNDKNRTWACRASRLGFVVAKKTFSHNKKPNAWAEYDCGAAWISLTLRARLLGLYTHGMAGIHHEAVHDTFAVCREQYKVIAGFAVGRLASPENLPAGFRSLEAPSARKPLEQIRFTDTFPQE